MMGFARRATGEQREQCGIERYTFEDRKLATKDVYRKSIAGEGGLAPRSVRVAPLSLMRCCINRVLRNGRQFRFHEVVIRKSEIATCPVGQITGTAPPSPRRHKGTKRDRHVTSVRVAMDAAASGGLARRAKRSQRTAKSCGPGAATVASIRPACAGTATVARNAVHRGEHV